MRGQFRGEMFRVTLTPDGRGVVNSEVVSFLLLGGLDLTQAPNGSVLAVRHREGVHVPDEPPTTGQQIKAVFPVRDPLKGASTLAIYGVNMDHGSGTPVVTIGGRLCTGVNVLSTTKLTCTLPSSPVVAKSDVVVDNGIVRSTFAQAYRYITGVE